MSLTLYALTERFQQLQDMLADGEVDESAIRDAMASVEGDITIKVDNIAAILRSLELEADAYRLEEVRLAERRKAIENNRERLRRYAMYELETVNLREIRGPRFFVTVQDSTPKVVIDDEGAVPSTYWREKREIDKQSMATALKAGEVVPGAHLERGRSLRVR